MRVEDVGQWEVANPKAVSPPKFFPGSTDHGRNSSTIIIIVDRQLDLFAAGTSGLFLILCHG